MEATSIFFVVRSGNDIIPTIGESERCFLCGPFTGYIVTSPAVDEELMRSSTRMEPTELVVEELRYSVVIIG
jgi:hypothetical protein